MGLYTNRLAREKSPYLLQHAHNPIDWYPWGEDAFNAAKREDKPIFLSIGYATCHWCHVMEKESFQNIELAQMMNECFINVKVDREEMPEIDSLYMEFAQAMMSGGAGWPLNLILTPDLNPFFAATYLPPDSSRGFLGMKQLIQRVKQIWDDPHERENVIMQAGKIVDLFSEHAAPPRTEMPQKEIITQAADLLFKEADPVFGGMKGAPKFPIGFQATFLLREARLQTDSRALFYVERSLEMMHRGGIYDHLGGGFSRYCIDEKWMVPHFEKMLYDNAILVRVYVEAFEYTKNTFYREVAEHIFQYVLREMKDEKGCFYSAEDADTEGKEGDFYTWTWDEIHHTLKENASLFCEFHGISPTGNFHGRNILHTPYSIAEFAEYRRLDKKVLEKLIKEMRKQLWQKREERLHPSKDDKVVTSYNGLMISALCEGGIAFNEPHLLDEAKRAAEFIIENLMVEDHLLRRWRDGEAKFDGCLDDYAFLIQGLISLFEADRGTHYLELALKLTGILERDFKAENGAYYSTNGKDPNLILRRCEFYDGSEPSGNAVQAENLIRLSQITFDLKFRERAKEIFMAAREHIDLYPPGSCYHLIALMRYLDENAPTILITLNQNEENKEEIQELLRTHYLPHKVVLWVRESDEALRDLLLASHHKKTIEGKTTVCICYPDRCQGPMSDLGKIRDWFLKNI